MRGPWIDGPGKGGGEREGKKKPRIKGMSEFLSLTHPPSPSFFGHEATTSFRLSAVYPAAKQSLIWGLLTVSHSPDEKIAAQQTNYNIHTYLAVSSKETRRTWKRKRGREREISFFGGITPGEESAKSEATDSEAKESTWLSGAA